MKNYRFQRGDYVSDCRGRIMRINSVQKDTVTCIRDNKEASYGYQEIFRIPLTWQVLKKLGFVMSEKFSGYEFDSLKILITNTGTRMNYQSSNTDGTGTYIVTPVTYVDEIQHYATIAEIPLPFKN